MAQFNSAGVQVIDGVQIVNATPHPIRFQGRDGSNIWIEPCGFTLAATGVEEHAGYDRGARMVRTVFVGSETGAAELEEIERRYFNALIVGSIISAQAYPGRVVSLVPVPGTERAAPADKIYLADKFNRF